MTKKNAKLYFALVVLLSVSSFVYSLLPSGDFGFEIDLPAPRLVIGLVNALTMLILYGGVGLIGLLLASKNGFASIWNENLKRDFLKISLVGVVIGVVFIITDIVFVKLFALPKLPHPSFPASIFASINAGIGEEIVFRLFFVSFWYWVLSKIIKSDKCRGILFWVIATISAIAFAAGHIPSIMMLFDYVSVSDMPLSLLGMIIWLNGLLSMFAAYYLKKYGFIAAAWVHFLVDVVWHIIYGGIG